MSLEGLKKYPGPWIKDHEEHTEKEYKFDYKNGISYIIKKMAFFTWNGYVQLAVDHPHYSKGYGDIEDLYNVHGGLTFSNGSGMFGFDTSHYNDLVPGFLISEIYPLDPLTSENCHYWTFDEVKKETLKLAEQFDSFKT